MSGTKTRGATCRKCGVSIAPSKHLADRVREVVFLVTTWGQDPATERRLFRWLLEVLTARERAHAQGFCYQCHAPSRGAFDKAERRLFAELQVTPCRGFATSDADDLRDAAELVGALATAMSEGEPPLTDTARNVMTDLRRAAEKLSQRAAEARRAQARSAEAQA